MLLFKCILITLWAGLVNAGRPAQIKILITKRGQQYASELARDLISQQVSSQKFPDMKDGSITVKNIGVSGVHEPDITLKPSPPNGLTIHAKNGEVDVSGSWDYKWLFLSESGTFSLKAKNMRIEVTLVLTHTPEGGPKIAKTTCKSELDVSGLQIHGKFLATVANWFKGSVSSRLDNTLQRTICQETIKMAQVDINRLLQKAPTQLLMFHDNMVIDTQLVEDPVFNSDESILIQQKGWLSWKGEDANSNITLKALPDFDSKDDRMALIMLSSTLLKSFMEAAQAHNQIRTTVTVEHASFLTTTCSTKSMCIGKLAPSIAKRYPDQSLQLELEMVSRPMFELQNGEIRFKFNATATAKAENSSEEVFKVLGVLEGSMKLQINGRYVAPTIALDNLHTIVQNSTVGEVDEVTFNCGLEFLKPFMVNAVNDALSEGMELPDSPMVRFLRPELKVVDEAIFLATDFVANL